MLRAGISPGRIVVRFGRYNIDAPPLRDQILHHFPEELRSRVRVWRKSQGEKKEASAVLPQASTSCHTLRRTYAV